MGRSADVLSAREGLDDEHRGAAVPAHECRPRVTVIDAVNRVGGRRGRWPMQERSSGRDIALAVGVGEQAVVSDAMKSRGQHVQQEATHELLALQRHGFVACPAVLAVVLPAEGDAAIIMGDEAGVGDGDPVRVAG